MTYAGSSRRRAVTGSGFIVLATVLTQWSAAIISPLFGVVGPAAASAFRFEFGAIILLVLARPRVGSWTRDQWVGVAVLGVSTAFMNQCFYHAIARIPLGTAVAIEYLGPFLLAALGRRSWRHFAFVLLAAIGVLALTRPGAGITWLGALFAAGSGLGWATYTLASHRVGGVTKGFGGLAVAMTISALVTSVPGVANAGVLVSHPDLLARAVATALMAIVIGFAAEMQALRRISPAVVSVLLALEPAAAFAVGWAFLGQSMGLADALGMICVVVAGVGVTVDVATSDVALAL